jgi:hypothetical protein
MVLDYFEMQYKNLEPHIKSSIEYFDLDGDGHISAQDVANNLVKLFNFLKDFEFYKEVHQIRSELYQQAIEYMKKELLDDDEDRESTLDDSGSQSDDISEKYANESSEDNMDNLEQEQRC